ncbi:response regulator transcription factor [Herbiconiux sp. CPCC 203407]|uniref:Response regulator transcription factor n=1 Tax=Herbiconiux oxytropis TaxID=2970915 RepID=A0AA42BVA7_9MICO|nr:response regulator transcription factor [Herbiconiux oxytropis]MCS5722771.1 response regulator transcription factor [Herbiconiux oxytropis]MCS5727041.1 response regulator transcription factor [Herbiconiux oxytropis]
MIRVLLADDHAMIRAGLRLMLETAPAITVVGEAGDGAEAVRLARRLAPDVVLMDVRMPGTDGIEATRRIVAERLAEVIVLTTFDLDEYVFGAIRAGAAGFLVKTAEASAVVTAVERVAAGEGMLSPEVTRRVLRAAAGGGGDGEGTETGVGAPVPASAPRTATPFDELTPRERAVLGCLAEGLSNQRIAERLVIEETTAKTHVSRVLAKLGCSSRLQAAMLARDARFEA